MVEVISHRAAAAAAVKLMSSVSVSFCSATVAVNDNEIGCRRQYMQRPIFPRPRNSTALGIWSAGKEPDALSKLVTGGIFHVQKNCYMLVGGCMSLIPLDPPLPVFTALHEMQTR